MIDNWEKFNELKRSTYNSAAWKIVNQPERRKKLLDYGKTKGLYEYPFLKDIELDIYVWNTYNNDGGKPYDRVLTFKMCDGLDSEEIDEDDYQMMDGLELTESSIKELKSEGIVEDIENIILTFFINHDQNGMSLDLGSFYEKSKTGRQITKYNKFANRKSFNKFLLALKKLYMFQDPNVSRKVISKINKAKTRELTWEDVEKNHKHNFWVFLQRYGYDFNKFRNDILKKSNLYWDEYKESTNENPKTKPNTKGGWTWTSTST